MDLLSACAQVGVLNLEFFWICNLFILVRIQRLESSHAVEYKKREIKAEKSNPTYFLN
jgi:hypothetical protein